VTVEATADTAGFRAVLHRWALAKLEAGATDHNGPYEILQVRVEHDEPSSVSSEAINVGIQFRHTECRYRGYDGNHPCPDVAWWSPYAGTVSTVRMLNELLATADGR
jgi:hypothetical protein